MVADTSIGKPTVDATVAWSVAVGALAGFCTLVWQVLRAVCQVP